MKQGRSAFALLVGFHFLTAQSLPVANRTETPPDSARYLGQTPPGNVPKIFTLPVRPGFFVAEKVAISPDGTEIFFSELNGYPVSAAIARIRRYAYSGNTWTGPFDAFQGFVAPQFSPGGDTLYFEDGRPDSWYSVRNDTGWGAPVRFWKSPHAQHNVQVVTSGRYYLVSDPSVSTTGDLSELLIQGSDTTVRSLGIPLNSSNNGMDFFIAKDESFIIRVIKSGGTGDLYISYHKPDGSWTNPKTLGPGLNTTQGWEWGAYVTDDQSYMFFTRQLSSVDIYWVRAHDLIDNLRHTNFIPYLKRGIANQSVTAGRVFGYTIPDSTFIDDDGNATLHYAAALTDGNPLPSWLAFDAAARTFSGTPHSAGTLNIKITATDTAHAAASCQFILSIVADPNGLGKYQGPPPERSELFQNYPNPFNPTTTIYYSLRTPSRMKLAVYDLLGRRLRILTDSFQGTGEHSLLWDGKDDTGRPVSSGMYFYRLESDNGVFQKKMMLLR